MPVTGCGRLATMLDIQMIQVNPLSLHPETTSDDDLPIRSGDEVAAELGGRLLLTYIRKEDVAPRIAGRSATLEDRPWRVYATPTAYAPREVAEALALPWPTNPRTHVVLIIPAKVPRIQGPRRVSCGYGVEYLLPDGYRADALKLGWEMEIA